MFGNNLKPVSTKEGSIINAEKLADALWWKRDESQARQFVGSGEDVFLTDKGEYKLPECQC